MLISTNSGLHSARPGKPRYDMCEAMDFLSAAGFEAVDVNFCAVIYSGENDHEPILDGDWETTIRTLKERIAADGMTVSHTHLPFRYNHPSDTPYYEDPMMYRSLEASAMLGAPCAVCHPLQSEKRETLVDETVRVFAPLEAEAKKLGITLAMENMFFTNPEQLAEIADRLNCGICWDIGHANLGGFSQSHALRLLGKRIKVLHLHDNYGKADNHNAPYFGNINWPEFVSLLEEIGYEGTFNYEVGCSKLPEGLRMEHARYLVKAAKLLLNR